MGNDIYMGGVRFTPDFDDMGAPQEQWYELSGESGKGKVMIALAYQPSTVSSEFVCSVSTFRLRCLSFFRFLSPQRPAVLWPLGWEFPGTRFSRGCHGLWSHLPIPALFPTYCAMLQHSSALAMLTLCSIELCRGP